MRGERIGPEQTSSQKFLVAHKNTDWQHEDPRRAGQTESVGDFDALANLGPAIACLGFARTPQSSPYYRQAQGAGVKLGQHCGDHRR